MNASQGRFRCVLVLAMLLLSGTTGYSQDDETPKKSENAKRLAFMSEVVEAFRLSPKEAKPGIARRFQNRPIMRYSDPTRGLVDATLWKLGSGRPQAIVTLELDRPVNEGDRLTYEFLSLTPEPFTLTTSHGWVWNPEDADSQFRRAEKTRAPAEKAAGRLQQMKRLARRFSVSEDLEGEESVLRLLPRPIDQYTVTDAGKKRSGTLFVFVHGTNPEALLLEPRPVRDNKVSEWSLTSGALSYSQHGSTM